MEVSLGPVASVDADRRIHMAGAVFCRVVASGAFEALFFSVCINAAWILARHRRRFVLHLHHPHGGIPVLSPNSFAHASGRHGWEGSGGHLPCRVHDVRYRKILLEIFRTASPSARPLVPILVRKVPNTNGGPGAAHVFAAE